MKKLALTLGLLSILLIGPNATFADNAQQNQQPQQNNSQPPQNYTAERGGGGGRAAMPDRAAGLQGRDDINRGDYYRRDDYYNRNYDYGAGYDAGYAAPAAPVVAPAYYYPGAYQPSNQQIFSGDAEENAIYRANQHPE